MPWFLPQRSVAQFFKTNSLPNLKIHEASSDSDWVIPVQIVPKKGGMTVVKNIRDELISTKKVTGGACASIIENSMTLPERTIFFSPSFIKLLKG